MVLIIDFAPLFHDIAMKMLNEFVLVGGMPIE